MIDKIILTISEQQILTLLARGYAPKQIGPMVNLSYFTVKFRITIIKARLGAQTITQAVAVAIAEGLISPFEK